MELQILHMIQGWHNDILDAIMVAFTTFGNAGLGWIAIGLILTIIPKTRKCGFSVLLAMLVTHIIGNIIVKPIVARPRPFLADPSVELIVKAPSSFSFPSGHSASSFTAALTIFFYYKKSGVIALLAVATIAFSRMYLFVHYPTDVLCGVLLGCVDACLIYWGFSKWMKRKGQLN